MIRLGNKLNIPTPTMYILSYNLCRTVNGRVPQDRTWHMLTLRRDVRKEVWAARASLRKDVRTGWILKQRFDLDSQKDWGERKQGTVWEKHRSCKMHGILRGREWSCLGQESARNREEGCA